MQNIPKIVSGGQTGADRAALDWALSHKLPCGGWCPKGRKAEVGPINSNQNILSKNLRQLPIFSGPNGISDATVLFSLASELTGGSKKTAEFAKKHHKPWIHLTAGDQHGAQRLKDWLAQNPVDVLNVAGPRASKEPGIAQFRHSYPRRSLRIFARSFGMIFDGQLKTRQAPGTSSQPYLILVLGDPKKIIQALDTLPDHQKLPFPQGR